MERIRAIDKSDYEGLLQMFNEFAAFQGMPAKMINSIRLMEAEADFIHGFVAEAESGELAGYVTFFYAYYTWSGKSLYIDDLYVRPDFRQRGRGKKLLLAVIKKAEAEGCKKVRWQVSRWNTPAVDFYKNMGAAIDDVELNCDYLIVKPGI